MAKQLVNPLERHVEKAVLGLSGLVLIGIIAKFLVTTPNQLELGGEVVTPKNIDEKLVDKAQVVRRTLGSLTAQIEPVEPVADDFATVLNPYESRQDLSTTLPLATYLGSPVPIIDPPFLGGEKTRLVEVVNPGKPGVSRGRTTFNIDDQWVPVNWVTVSAPFDRAEQMRLQLRTYGARWRVVVFAPAELQRRERQSDGGWSESDWETITPYPSATVPPVPGITLIEEEGQTIVESDKYTAVQKYFESMEVADRQLEFIRPLMLTEINGDGWRFPASVDELELARQDEEYLYPNDPPREMPGLDRYPNITGAYEVVIEEHPEADSGSDKGKTRNQVFNEAEQKMADAHRFLNENFANHAYNLMFEIYHNKDAPAGDRAKAKRIMEQADQLYKDILLAKKTGNNPQGSTPSQGNEQEKKKDNEAVVKREPLPKQYIWVHDAESESVKDGATYQYRMRFVIFNNLLGVPEKFDDPKLALVDRITSEWSEPSDPITIPPRSEVYVARGDERDQETRLELYQWFQGVWTRGSLNVTVGDTVAVVQRAKIPDPTDPTQPYQGKVSFDTGLTVVDIDFDRRVREWQSERGGVRVGAPERTTAVVFVDESGRLHERYENWDKKHPGRSAAKEREWRP